MWCGASGVRSAPDFGEGTWTMLGSSSRLTVIVGFLGLGVVVVVVVVVVDVVDDVVVGL